MLFYAGFGLHLVCFAVYFQAFSTNCNYRISISRFWREISGGSRPKTLLLISTVFSGFAPLPRICVYCYISGFSGVEEWMHLGFIRYWFIDKLILIRLYRYSVIDKKALHCTSLYRSVIYHTTIHCTASRHRSGSDAECVHDVNNVNMKYHFVKTANLRFREKRLFTAVCRAFRRGSVYIPAASDPEGITCRCPLSPNIFIFKSPETITVCPTK